MGNEALNWDGLSDANSTREYTIAVLSFSKASVTKCANVYATLDLRTKRVIYNHNKKIS